MSNETRGDGATTPFGRFLWTVAIATSVGGLGLLTATVLDSFDEQDQVTTEFPAAGSGGEPVPSPATSPLEVSAAPATDAPSTIPNSSAPIERIIRRTSTTSPTTTSPTTTSTTSPTTTSTTSTTTTSTTSTTLPPTTEPAPPPPASTAVPSTLSMLPTYSTLPDGSPVPVIAVFDLATVTLTGAVPSQAAADRLAALAVANSKTPVTVASSLTIDPAVPMNVGVRVLELNSIRFPPGSAEIVPAHALEFDRVATVMNALPNVTVLVVGHADQRGDDAVNLALSKARADAIVDYLITRGVAPARLSSRGVGEADLVSLGNDETALALNRRSEFVFFGLVLGS